MNSRSAGVKRLMKDAEELRNPTDMYFAQPLEDDLFEWHFTVRGPPDTDFAEGIYHGRIILPPDYPMKPPSVILLTPNGRFELNKRICLSISGFHPESWQPSWSIRTALLAIIGFFPTHSAGAIGGLEYPPEERRKLAKKSVNWTCEGCGVHLCNVLSNATQDVNDVEQRQLAAQITVSNEQPNPETNDTVETIQEQPEESGVLNNGDDLTEEPMSTTTITANNDTVSIQQPSRTGQLAMILALVAIFVALLYRRLSLYLE